MDRLERLRRSWEALLPTESNKRRDVHKRRKEEAEEHNAKDPVWATTDQISEGLHTGSLTPFGYYLMGRHK